MFPFIVFHNFFLPFLESLR